MTDQYRVRALRVDRPARTVELQITATNPDSAGLLFIDEQFLIMALRDLVARAAPSSVLHGFTKLDFETTVDKSTNRTLIGWVAPYGTTSLPFDRADVIATENYPFRKRIESDADAEAYRAKPSSATYRIVLSHEAYLEGMAEGLDEGSTAIGRTRIDSVYKKFDCAKSRILSGIARELEAHAEFAKKTGVILPTPTVPAPPPKATKATKARAAKKA